MPYLPKQLATLVGGDSALARVSSNLRTAVQPTLDFLNTYMASGADGSLQLLRNVVAIAPVLFRAPVTAQAGATLFGLVVNGLARINGSQVIFGNSTNCLVIVPGAASGVAFYITNQANSLQVFTVNIDGSVNAIGPVAAPSFVSAAGFKNTVACGGYFNSNYNANAVVQTQLVTMNNAALGNAGSAPFETRITHSGSVVGIALRQNGTNAGAQQVQIFRNGVLAYAWPCGAGASTTVFGTFAKNTPGLAFAPGDRLTVFYTSTAANNVNVQPYLTFEMAA